MFDSEIDKCIQLPYPYRYYQRRYTDKLLICVYIYNWYVPAAQYLHLESRTFGIPLGIPLGFPMNFAYESWFLGTLKGLNLNLSFTLRH